MSALGRSKFSDFVVKAVLISFALAGLALGAENPLGEVMTNSDDAMTNSPIDGVTFRYINVNGISMRIAEAGDNGPLVLLAHGWPESWYSWRHQLKYLSESGYRRREDGEGSVANVRGRREAGVRGRARANGEGGERASGGARERGGGVVRRVRDGAGLGARVARVAEQRVARDRDRTPRRGVRGVRVRRLGGCFGARSASRGDDDEGEGVSTTVAKCD